MKDVETLIQSPEFAESLAGLSTPLVTDDLANMFVTEKEEENESMNSSDSCSSSDSENKESRFKRM